MFYLNPSLYSQDFVEKLQEKVEDTLLNGYILTEFISEGTTLKGIAAYKIQDVIEGIDYYWLEVEGSLVSETQPNFRGNNFGSNLFN